jgi:hypothetical protein
MGVLMARTPHPGPHTITVLKTENLFGGKTKARDDLLAYLNSFSGDFAELAAFASAAASYNRRADSAEVTAETLRELAVETETCCVPYLDVEGGDMGDRTVQGDPSPNMTPGIDPVLSPPMTLRQHIDQIYAVSGNSTVPWEIVSVAALEAAHVALTRYDRAKAANLFRWIADRLEGVWAVEPTGKGMMPLSDDARKAIDYAGKTYGKAIQALMREFVDIERRLDWLNEHEPLNISGAMSDEEITAALDADPNIEERRKLARRKDELGAKIPTSVLATYRFPGTPMVVF